ncbi:hypothetical protein BDR04DRAFT_1141843 [Suillus decipiens]|nr:hypothetical protein BDR04DRAFT_1141843 [Suillus decipiens]
MEESPETLLAILQTLYPHGSKVANTCGTRRDPLLEFDEHSSKKSKRTMALLDAVAAISVQHARNQVIAVSITVNPNKCVIHIAGNDGVSEETLSHLRHIFTQLKFIRSSLAQPLEAGTDMLDTPAPQKSDETHSLEKNLFHSICTFSWRKFRRRVVKRQTRFETEVIPCMEKFADENRGSWTSEEASDYQKFQEVVITLSLCFQWAKMDPQDEYVLPTISRLGNYVHGTALEMRRMLEDESTTSRITSWEMEIKRIDPVSESNTFTLSKDVIRQIVMGSGLTDNDAIEEATLSIISAFPSSFADAKSLTRSITNKIHCEALLLRYHVLNPAFPPFNYIGVSKLSCYPCYALFHAFNKSVGRGHKYFVKGCHNKLYGNWIFPNFTLLDKSLLLDSSIRRHSVGEHFAMALMEWLKLRSISRCSSDSTGVSTTSRGTEVKARDYTVAEVLEYISLSGPPKIYITQKSGTAIQGAQSSSQTPPPNATASTLSAVTGTARATGTPSHPYITGVGWRARFAGWVCCMPIQNTDGHH